MYKNQVQVANETKSVNNVYAVETKTTNVEREVDQYIKNIRSLINRVAPSQRQQYYNGLLAFILDEQVELSNTAMNKSIEHKDLSKLSVKELNLIEEMSVKMQQLHQLIGDDVEC